MSNYLTVVIAEADAARRHQDLLRNLDRARRAAEAPTPGRPPLRARLTALVARRRSAVA